MRRWLEHTSPLKVALTWVVMILAWEAAWRAIGWKYWLFPAPSHVIDSTLGMLNVQTHFAEPVGTGWPWKPPEKFQPPPPTSSWIWDSPLPMGVLASGVRLLVGFAISLFLGGVLGLLMWRYPFIDSLFGPLFLGLQTLPSVCWVPLAILAIGINEASIIFVLVMGSFFAIAIALRDGLRQTPPIYKRAALMLGARRWNLYRYVLLPAGMPAMASSLRQGFSFAWRSLMGGEFVFMLQRRGVGFLLSIGRELGHVEQVVAIMIVMVLIGMAADRFVFARIERRVRTRFGLI